MDFFPYLTDKKMEKSILTELWYWNEISGK